METVAASDELARKVRELRERQHLSFRDLEAKLREQGRPILASGLLKLERCERRTDVDELAALAAALGVGVLELLGLQPVAPSAPVAPSPPPPPAPRGGLEKTTRADLARLGELSPLETTLVETAIRLATAIDAADDARTLPGLTKELRATVQELGAGRRRAEKPPDEDDFGDLDDPD